MLIVPKPKKRSGFTLAESLIVVTLVVILSLLVLLYLNPLTHVYKGFDTRRKDDLDKLQIIMEEYYADHGSYPPNTVLDHCGGSNLQPYLNAIPCDPNTKEPYKKYFIAGTGGSDTKPQKYIIYAHIDSPASDLTANEILNCPQTIAVHSPNVSNADLIKGCSGITICPNYYGCQSGQCTLITHDLPPRCNPNSCDSDCGGVDCSKQTGGVYTNECVPF